jgi:hypothetical protein
MSRFTRAIGLAGGAALAAAALAGCGKIGELERPAPLFGRAPAGNAQAQAQAQAGEEASSPVRTIDPRNEFLNPAPPRAAEIPGLSPDPIAPGPQGALPDPYANPR